VVVDVVWCGCDCVGFEVDVDNLMGVVWLYFLVGFVMCYVM